MDVVGGRVDIGDHRVDRRIGVGHQLRGVPADRLETADRLAEPEQVLVSLRHVGPRVFLVPGHRGGQRRHAGDDRAQLCRAATPDVCLTEQQIGDDTDDRQRGDHHDPGDPGGGLSMGPGEHANDQGRLPQYMDGDGGDRADWHSIHNSHPM